MWHRTNGWVWMAALACGILAALAFGVAASASMGDDPNTQARVALREKQLERAIELASQTLQADAKNAEAYLIRGMAREQARQFEQAIADLNRAVELKPTRPILLQALLHRATARFRSGAVEDSVKDFEALLAMNPSARPELWQYGIALYYVGRYADGVKLFADHRQVNPEDVENAAWHFLCNAKANDVNKARAELIPVKRDDRVPMAEVQQLLAGKVEPIAVLEAAEAGQVGKAERTRRRFYANLYLGYYFEALGESAKAREHIERAVRDYRVSDYMWDVGKVHLDRLTKKR
jgi:lipoprotein NlpI